MRISTKIKNPAGFLIVTATEAICTLACCLLLKFEGVLETVFLSILLQIGIQIIYSKIGIARTFKFAILEIVRFLILLFLLSLFWYPTLAKGYAWDSYDPIKYYYYAKELIVSRTRNFGLSYMGIAYWYAFWMKIFGCNPVVPLLVNAFFTEICVCALYDLTKEVYFINVSMTKFFVVLSFIPELLWYDVLSSRETICMNLFALTIWEMYQYLRKTKKFKWYLFCALLLTLGIIRASFLLSALVVIIILLIKESKRTFEKYFVTPIIIGLILLLSFVVIMINSRIGSDFSDIKTILSSVTEGSSVLTNSNYTWGESSIARLLVAGSYTQLILLLPLRVIAYFIIPLPNVYLDCQRILAVVSSCIYIIWLPRLLASLADIWRKQRSSLPWVFLIVMVTVSSGTMLLHERYRILAIPWIVISMLAGKKMPIRIRRRSCFFVSTCGVIFVAIYAVYKYVL